MNEESLCRSDQLLRFPPDEKDMVCYGSCFDGAAARMPSWW